MQARYGASVCTLHACAQFGEMALMEDEPARARRAATVVAADEAHTLVISKSLYDGVLRARQQQELRDKVRGLWLLPQNTLVRYYSTLRKYAMVSR